jgi:hypothetical protein
MLHWAWIEATAAALLRKKTLTHNEILSLRPKEDRDERP